MSRVLYTLLAVGTVLAVSAPDAAAQRSNGNGKGKANRGAAVQRGPDEDRRDDRARRARDRRDRRDDDREWRRDRDRRRDDGYGLIDIILGRDRDRDRYERRRGPKFCRNGRGHPVHGRRWCYEKGFDRGWSWEDIIFRERRARRDRRLGAETIIDILGEVVFGRFAEHGRRIDARGPITGRWLDGGLGRGDVLRLYVGDTPLAELYDRDGDRRVDRVRLKPRR